MDPQKPSSVAWILETTWLHFILEESVGLRVDVTNNKITIGKRISIRLGPWVVASSSSS